MRLPQPPLLVITDRHQAREPLEIMAEHILAGGCRWLSLREKDLAADERLALLERLLSLGRVFEATIGIHGDIDAARRVGAGHIHLPAGANPAEIRRQLGKEVLIGISAHNLAEAEAAQRGSADYCTLSPIFPSPSKPNYGPALGLASLERIAKHVSIPLIALGGVEPDTFNDCLAAGASGVAVMGGIMRAGDPLGETRRCLEAL
jgi:thiamine-phosphate pyrophosphorylase